MRLVLMLMVLAFQTAEQPGVFTTQQAEKGRAEILKNSFGTCSDCHTTALTGRTGEPGELPELSSLKEDARNTINVYRTVPALVGTKFLARWSDRSTKDLTQEFQGRFNGPLSEETRLDIIAYLLQLSGAKPGAQPLTMTTDVKIGSLFAVKN
jgi:hypothetical protein